MKLPQTLCVLAGKTLLEKLPSVQLSDLERFICQVFLEGVVEDLGSEGDGGDDLIRMNPNPKPPQPRTPVKTVPAHRPDFHSPDRVSPDAKFMSKYSRNIKPLYDVRSNPPRLITTGWNDMPVAAATALLASGRYSFSEIEEETGVENKVLFALKAKAELMSLLPEGEARKRWLQLRYNFGGAPDAEPNEEVIDKVTRLLLGGAIHQAITLLQENTTISHIEDRV